ncbi:lipopolysaccharide biosynthesis protein [Kineococcus rubinsiae]|uniref:lipopolysaccharide biosynthesis protein n=1 Tax=Kineococcus rubinsiae TaxID=2609562 RepID=UPI00142F95EA|nr:lipopolysaccharide biosynthesis protein [Kineococcus rubinsiae]
MTTVETAGGGDLRRAAASGTVWQGAAYVGGKAVVAVSTVVLARLLAPEAFGVVALATVFISYADVVSDLGVAQAVIYRPGVAGVVRAATACSLLFGLFLSGGALLLAAPIATYFGDPQVAPLVRMLSVALLAGAAASVPQALLRRDLRFRTLGVLALAQALCTGGVAVVLALRGAGPTAIVTGSVVGACIYAGLAWTTCRARAAHTGARVRRSDLRLVLAYGLPVAGGMLLAKLVADIDYLVVGRQQGVEQLGLYTLAFRVPELIIINAFFVVSSVTFPLYARASGDPVRMRRGYLSSVRAQSVYGLCAGAGLAVLSPAVVPIVLGSQWRGAVVPMALLAIYAALRSLGAGTNDVYKAMGRPRIILVVASIRLAVLATVLVVVARWGIVAVAVAQVAAAAAFVVLMQGVAMRLLGLRTGELVRAVAPSLAAGSAVALTCGAVLLVPVGDAVHLAMAVPLAVGAAAAALHLTAPTFLPGNVALLRRRKVATT